MFSRLLPDVSPPLRLNISPFCESDTLTASTSRPLWLTLPYTWVCTPHLWDRGWKFSFSVLRNCEPFPRAATPLYSWWTLHALANTAFSGRLLFALVAVLLVSEAGCHVAQTGLELPLSPRRTLGFWFSCLVLGLQDHASMFSLCSAGTGPKTSCYIFSPRDVFFYWNRVSLCRPHRPQTHISRGRIMCMSNLNAADILSTHWHSAAQCGFGYVHRDVQLWPWPHSIMISPSQMETLCPWGNHFPFLFPTSSQLPPVYFIICLFWEFDINARIFQKYRNSLYVYVYICTCVGVHVYLYICGNVTGICEWVYMCKCVYVFV